MRQIIVSLNTITLLAGIDEQCGTGPHSGLCVFSIQLNLDKCFNLNLIRWKNGKESPQIIQPTSTLPLAHIKQTNNEIVETHFMFCHNEQYFHKNNL